MASDRIEVGLPYLSLEHHGLKEARCHKRGCKARVLCSLNLDIIAEARSYGWDDAALFCREHKPAREWQPVKMREG